MLGDFSLHGPKKKVEYPMRRPERQDLISTAVDGSVVSVPVVRQSDNPSPVYASVNVATADIPSRSGQNVPQSPPIINLSSQVSSSQAGGGSSQQILMQENGSLDLDNVHPGQLQSLAHTSYCLGSVNNHHVQESSSSGNNFTLNHSGMCPQSLVVTQAGTHSAILLDSMHCGKNAINNQQGYTWQNNIVDSSNTVGVNGFPFGGIPLQQQPTNLMLSNMMVHGVEQNNGLSGIQLVPR